MCDCAVHSEIELQITKEHAGTCHGTNKNVSRSRPATPDIVGHVTSRAVERILGAGDNLSRGLFHFLNNLDLQILL